MNFQKKILWSNHIMNILWKIKLFRENTDNTYTYTQCTMDSNCLLKE